MRSVLFLTVILMLSTLPASAEQSVILWNQPVNLQAGQYTYHLVTVPFQLVNGRIAGSYQATGGENNDITFHVLNADQFKTYVAKGPYTSLYTADKRRSEMVSVPIRDPGTYYLVFDNSFSISSPKQVRSDLRLVYDGIDQRADQLVKLQNDQVKKIGDILGKPTEDLQEREETLGTRQIRPPIQFGIFPDKSLNAFAISERNLAVLPVGAFNRLLTYSHARLAAKRTALDGLTSESTT